MELTVEQLRDKVISMRAQLDAFTNAEQNEINMMQANVQNRLRAAQKWADQQEGRIAVYQEMLNEMTPEPAEQPTEQVLPLSPAPLTSLPVAPEAAE